MDDSGCNGVDDCGGGGGGGCYRVGGCDRVGGDLYIIGTMSNIQIVEVTKLKDVNILWETTNMTESEVFVDLHSFQHFTLLCAFFSCVSQSPPLSLFFKLLIFFKNFYLSKTWDLQNKGIRVFLFQSDASTLIANLLKTVELFIPVIVGPGVGTTAAEANVEFLSEYAHKEMSANPTLMDPPSADQVSH